jgi:hypothetical protein
MKPFFDTDGFFGDGFGFTTSILDATVVVPFSPGPALFVRMGLAHATIEGAPSSSTLSNPRLGVLFGEEGATNGELHVDLPLGSEFGDDDYATGMAFLTDFERIERFLPDAWSAGGSVTAESITESDTRFGGRLGANVWVPTEDGADAEVIGLFGGFVRVPARSARIGAELSGLVIVSESGLSLGERMTSHLTLSGALPSVAASPEVYVRLPLDDDVSEALKFVLGLRARVGG